MTYPAVSAGSFTVNAWQQFTVTVPYTAPTATLYRNGVSIASGTGISFPAGTWQTAFLGRPAWNVDVHMSGFIASFAVYPAALTSTQVANLYNGVSAASAPPLPPPAPPPPPLVTSATRVAAYSTRIIVPSWVGQPVVNIRNGRTGVTADFYSRYNPSGALMFDLVTVDGVTTFSSWIGGDTGFVTMMYDQTGESAALHSSRS